MCVDVLARVAADIDMCIQRRRRFMSSWSEREGERVCVWERERERVRERASERECVREGERERQRERERERG